MPACVLPAFPASKSVGDTADTGAQSPRAPKESEPELRRVIVLVPLRPETTNPKAQPRIDQARAARSKARRKPKRRLFALPTESKATVPAPVPGRQEGGAGKRAPAALPTDNTKNANATAKNDAGKSGDSVPPDQRVPLAQALLADILTERLHERLGLTVMAEGEVNAALQELHLTPAEAARPQNALRLCARLDCQAIIVPRVETCVIHEGATRDVVLYTHAEIQRRDVMLPQPVSKTGENQSLRPVETRWPDQLDIAGTASADRILFHSQYKKLQGDLIREATQQAVNLLIHALRTGEPAPFMRAADRLAVPPIPAPMRADKLVFTPMGRRVQPSAVGNLNPDASALFTPDLLPLLPERIIEAAAVRPALPAQDPNGLSLWAGEDLPNTSNAQALGRKLRVGYLLLARVTDVEFSEGASNPSLPSAASESRFGTPAAPDRERAVRVEAAAALVRVSDGALLWHDRATATMTAPMTPPVHALRPQSDQSLVHDATRFALVELERRLRKYRATYEK